MIALLAGLQFLLQGLNNVVSGWAMLAVWFAGAALVGAATMQIERYFIRRRRWER